jgi:ribosomal-protein-alanine N-acetyltransferase
VIPRPATAADVPAVAALDRMLFGVDAWSEDQVAEELLAEHRRAWVVGEPVLGYAVTRTVDDVTDLQRIAVHPDHRRRGVARALLDAAAGAGAAGAAGATTGHRMLLEVSAGNTGAVAFYAAEGFVEIARRRRYYRDGSDALVLQRDRACHSPLGPGSNHPDGLVTRPVSPR